MDASAQMERYATLKVPLGDVLLFINWMQQAHRAYEQRTPLSLRPQPESGEVGSWIRLVETLYERSQRSEERQMSLEANLQAQEQEVGRLLSHLHENIATLYDALGQGEKAEAARRRAASIQTR